MAIPRYNHPTFNIPKANQERFHNQAEFKGINTSLNYLSLPSNTLQRGLNFSIDSNGTLGPRACLKKMEDLPALPDGYAKSYLTYKDGWFFVLGFDGVDKYRLYTYDGTYYTCADKDDIAIEFTDKEISNIYFRENKFIVFIDKWMQSFDAVSKTWGPFVPYVPAIDVVNGSTAGEENMLGDTYHEVVAVSDFNDLIQTDTYYFDGRTFTGNEIYLMPFYSTQKKGYEGRVLYDGNGRKYMVQQVFDKTQILIEGTDNRWNFIKYIPGNKDDVIISDCRQIDGGSDVVMFATLYNDIIYTTNDLGDGVIDETPLSDFGITVGVSAKLYDFSAASDNVFVGALNDVTNHLIYMLYTFIDEADRTQKQLFIDNIDGDHLYIFRSRFIKAENVSAFQNRFTVAWYYSGSLTAGGTIESWDNMLSRSIYTFEQTVTGPFDEIVLRLMSTNSIKDISATGCNFVGLSPLFNPDDRDILHSIVDAAILSSNVAGNGIGDVVETIFNEISDNITVTNPTGLWQTLINRAINISSITWNGTIIGNAVADAAGITDANRRSQVVSAAVSADADAYSKILAATNNANTTNPIHITDSVNYIVTLSTATMAYEYKDATIVDGQTYAAYTQIHTDGYLQMYSDSENDYILSRIGIKDFLSGDYTVQQMSYITKAPYTLENIQAQPFPPTGFITMTDANRIDTNNPAFGVFIETTWGYVYTTKNFFTLEPNLSYTMKGENASHNFFGDTSLVDVPYIRSDGGYVIYTTPDALYETIAPDSNGTFTVFKVVTDPNFVRPNINDYIQFRNYLTLWNDYSIYISDAVSAAHVTPETNNNYSYYPKYNSFTFESKIQNCITLASNLLLVACKNTLYYVTYNEDIGAYQTQSTNKYIASVKAAFMSSYDNTAYLLTHNGVSVLKQTENIANVDRDLINITQNIDDLFISYNQDDCYFCSYAYHDMFVFVGESYTRILALDRRSGTWWNWEYDYPLTNFFTMDSYLHFNSNASYYLNDEFSEFLQDDGVNVDLDFLVNPMTLGSRQQYKHVNELQVITSVNGEDMRVNMQLSFGSYDRNMIGKITHTKVIDFVHVIRMPVHLAKCFLFQYRLSSVGQKNRRFSINNILIKYVLGDII